MTIRGCAENPAWRQASMQLRSPSASASFFTRRSSAARRNPSASSVVGTGGSAAKRSSARKTPVRSEHVQEASCAADGRRRRAGWRTRSGTPGSDCSCTAGQQSRDSGCLPPSQYVETRTHADGLFSLHGRSYLHQLSELRLLGGMRPPFQYCWKLKSFARSSTLLPARFARGMVFRKNRV